MSQTHLPSHWIEKLCAILSIGSWRNGVFNHQVARLFTAWSRAEGGTATWNPLNTTEHVHSTDFGDWQGHDYNSTGVANFKEQWMGVQATSVTLFSPRFAGLVDTLRNAETTGITAEQIVQQHETELSQWGTNANLMLTLLKEIS